MNAFIVAKRLIKQIRSDKRSLGLMFVAPIFVMFLLSIILTSGTTRPAIDVINVPAKFVKILKKDAVINKVDTEKQAKADIRNKEADAYIIVKDNVPTVVMEGADPTKTKLVMTLIQKAMMENLSSTTKEMAKTLTKMGETISKMVPGQIPGQPSVTGQAYAVPQTAANQNIAPAKPPVLKKPVIKFYYGSKDFEAFDSLAPLLMGFFIFFFVFLIAGISFLRERISGTLDRILATPLRRGEIVMGYFLGFGLFVSIQTVLIQVFMIYGLKVTMAGSFWVVLLLNLLLATVALSLGTFLSAYARNEFQLIQFIPIIIVPQILFSGIFDLSEAPAWAAGLSKVFPLTYGARALRDVMIRGFSLSDVSRDVLVLIGFCAVFLVLNTIALRKYRKV